MRLPSRAGNTLSEAGAAFAARVNEWNRKPSTGVVAEVVGITQTKLTFLLEAGGSAVSMSQPENEEGMKFLEDQLEQTLVPPADAELQRRVEQASLVSALRALERREEKILALRYGLEGGDPHTLRQIGDRMGLSRERIRQIESKAIQRLRQNWRPLPLQAV
jgi:RNA polymerase primary sigma factor